MTLDALVSAPRFTSDWTTGHTGSWQRLLRRLVGKPNVVAIEIGCWEGRSTLWFLKNVLTHDTSRIVCVDPYPRTTFLENVRPFRDKVILLRQISQLALRDASLVPSSFDFVYVDGDHRAAAVLEDAVLAFRLLKDGGIMIFDDYRLKSKTPDAPQSMPKIAIDAFLSVFRDHLVIVAGESVSSDSGCVKEIQVKENWQVAVRKVGPKALS